MDWLKRIKNQRTRWLLDTWHETRFIQSKPGQLNTAIRSNCRPLTLDTPRRSTPLGASFTDLWSIHIAVRGQPGCADVQSRWAPGFSISLRPCSNRAIVTALHNTLPISRLPHGHRVGRTLRLHNVRKLDQMGVRRPWTSVHPGPHRAAVWIGLNKGSGRPSVSSLSWRHWYTPLPVRHVSPLPVGRFSPSDGCFFLSTPAFFVVHVDDLLVLWD